MSFKDIRYEVRADGVAVITMARPEYRNAQSYRMLDEIDRAFDLAAVDEAVRVLVIRGSGGVFSAGHDLGTADQLAYRAAQGVGPGVGTYDQFRKYNLDLLIKWRAFPKPVVAMVEGYCIYAGWMLAAIADVVYAADDAQFLAGYVEYMCIPWDIGIRRAKELVFESRFIGADEAAQYGLVNRVFSKADIEAETMGYAARVAQNEPEVLRFSKVQMNKAQDHQGFTRSVDDSFGDYVAMMYLPGANLRMDGQKRLLAVDLALQGRKGERPGLTPAKKEAAE